MPNYLANDFLAMQSNRKFAAILALPPCKIGIQITSEEEVFEIFFLPPDTAVRSASDPFAMHATKEIRAYLNNSRHRFKLPLAKRGTDFQRRIWQGIADIPAGEVKTYGVLAKNIASNARAVGQACGSNPFPLIVPCHRVISQKGIGGFAHASDGWLIATKRWLLAHEGVKGMSTDLLL